MEGPSSLPSDSNSQNSTVAPAGGSGGGGGAGASKFLADLPSRGLFSATVLSSNPGGMRVYICDHDTSPPEDQLIRTNQTNILIRSLMLKKQRGDSSSKDGKGIAGNESSKKGLLRKPWMAGLKSQQQALILGKHVEGSKSRIPQKDLQNLTVERIRALLKEKGLSPSGRKHELIARLRGATE